MEYSNWQLETRTLEGIWQPVTPPLPGSLRFVVIEVPPGHYRVVVGGVVKEKKLVEEGYALNMDRRGNIY